MPVQVQGPDGNTYQFPDGTDKNAAIAYFKKKGIGAKITATPGGILRPLTDRERFTNPDLYPVGLKGEGLGENLKNLAQRGGVGIFNLVDAAVNPGRTVRSIVGTLLPDQVINLLNKSPDAKGREIPIGEPNPIASAYQAVAPGGWQAAGNVAPMVGQILATGGFGEAAPEIASDVRVAIRKIPEAVRSSLKSSAGLTPFDIREEAQKAVDANREVIGKESVEAEKLRLKHEKELRDIQEHNQRVNRRHAEVSRRIQEENNAQENILNLRRQKDADLQRATDAYRSQEEATDTRAKATENRAWGAWRTKIKGATIDGKEIAAPLKKLRLDSPEVDRTLRQLEPSGDEVPQESPYAQLRDQTARANFQGNYADLSPTKQEAVDVMMVRAGESPEPIDLDPQEGKPISVERVQRANSILQRYIRSGRFEGPLLGEMKQVAKVLRRAVTDASEAHNALEDLDRARAETIRYQEAFGRERPEPRTVRGERERTANPEEVKRLQEEERLEAARRYDPSLADAQQKVKAAREEVKKLPSEDQLRKARKQIPAPPSVNHPYDAFRLKKEPPVPAKRLTAGSPEERANQQVPLAEAAEFPNRPPENIPKLTSLSPESIAKEQADKLREIGLKKLHQGPMGGKLLSGGISTWALAEALRGEWHYAAALGAARVILSMPRELLGRLLENEGVARWLSAPTERELKVYQTLSPDQKAVFGESLNRLAPVAKAKGIRIDPRWYGIAVVAAPKKRVAAALAP